MIEVDSEGRLMLSPATVQTVTGSASPGKLALYPDKAGAV